MKSRIKSFVEWRNSGALDEAAQKNWPSQILLVRVGIRVYPDNITVAVYKDRTTGIHYAIPPSQ